ncbi:MAG: TetR/AcrR family transcriptional regulator [Sphingorhabdus sp.]|uniref:TetR/AcrR family transcriptional regulator n=1 Tax=Sphingorhabdus sp. TaxID=1902408 RepID=UPI003C88530A
MPPAPKHKDNIVDAAITLFRQRGYSATGLNDIVSASGAPKGSVYHYFPNGKASIAAAAVETAGERVTATLEKIAAEKSTVGDVLKAHAALLGQWLRDSEFRDGCPITTVLLEMAPKDRVVTVAGRHAFAARNNLLSERLVAEGWTSEAADQMAMLCTCALQGALVQARIDRSARPLEQVAATLAEQLNRQHMAQEKSSPCH